MIYGGEHIEWPEDYFYDTAYDKEAEMEMNRDYEEAMWEQLLKDGPPQDDDILWIKWIVWKAGVAHGISLALTKPDRSRWYVDDLPEDLKEWSRTVAITRIGAL